MKRFCVFIIACVIISTLTDAQYSVNKKKYDYKDYKHQPGDPYSPFDAALESLLIPGLGHFSIGENGRGAAFLSAYAGCWICTFTGIMLTNHYFSLCTEETINNYNPEYCDMAIGPLFIFIGVLGVIGVPLEAMGDASRVAKVNNLAWRDQQTTYLNIKLQPYISPAQLNQSSMQVGLSLKFSF